MAKDPYKYFRVEARDLVQELNRGLLELEKDGQTRELVSRLLRLAHTLKGAARVVKQVEVAELAHAVEEVLTPFRQGDTPVPRERITELFRLLDAIGARLKAIEPSARTEGKGPAQTPAVEELFQTVRVDVEDIDRLLDRVAAASVAVDAARSGTARLDESIGMVRALGDALATRRNGEGNGPSAVWVKAHTILDRLLLALEQTHHALGVRLERADREIRQARGLARELRLVPASAVFASLERTARDAAESLGKKVRFEATGGDNHLDTHVLGALRDALLHVVRNAVAHGIESESERVVAGKSAVGVVRLSVERQGHRLAFACQDDGRGLDLAAIRQAAVRRHLVSPEQVAALGMEAAVQLLFQGGVSTTASVTELSGRGIGLAVVRDITTRLKGELVARTEAGRGTTVEICVPVSLASIPALAVDVAGTVASLPLESVCAALRVKHDEIARSPEGDAIVYEGQALPFLPLSMAIGRQDPRTRQSRSWSVVVLQADNAQVAVGVDRLLGTSSVVMKGLPPALGTIPNVAGASFDAEGSPQLVLDPVGLAAEVRAKRGSLIAPVAPVRPKVLVIDDSLTTRMLEQSILEAAGYEVDLATSGEEALEMAKKHRYTLFIVDIEMPGMDGFQFIEGTKRDPALREIPSILVTSRASMEDRRRGEEVGARAYIVKSEFDEAGFLQRIRDLIARSE